MKTKEIDKRISLKKLNKKLKNISKGIVTQEKLHFKD